MVHIICLLLVSVLSMAAAKILAVKVGTSIDQARLPCQPACLVLDYLFVNTTSVEVDIFAN
jgi:hypothetical protein